MTNKAGTRRVVAMINPKAGRVARYGELDGVFDAIRRNGMELELRYPSGGEELGRLAASAECDVLVLFGGDGTISSALQYFERSDDGTYRAPLIAVIPFGTANVVARDLGLPLEPRLAAMALRAALPVPLDIGEVIWPNGRRKRFVLSVGAGAIGEAVARVSGELKSSIGRGAYGIAAATAAFGDTPVAIRAGDEELRGQLAFAILTRHYAGGFVPDSSAQSGDGFLDLYLACEKGVGNLFSMIRSARGGNLRSNPDFRFVRTESFEILSNGPIEIDGDAEVSGPVTIRTAGRISFLGVPV